MEGGREGERATGRRERGGQMEERSVDGVYNESVDDRPTVPTHLFGFSQSHRRHALRSSLPVCLPESGCESVSLNA